MSKTGRRIIVTVLLLIIVSGLLYLNLEKLRPAVAPEPFNIEYDPEKNTIDLNSMTLKQKIAQMLIVYEVEPNKHYYRTAAVGGIYMTSKQTHGDFKDTIDRFQEGTAIPFFITADMEGCINPFTYFRDFPTLPQIKTVDEAYEVGHEQGELLNQLGFTINFAPVVDLEDSIWGCRSFTGSPTEISDKANAYIKGLQDNHVIATAKHYPGRTLSIRDPHKFILEANIHENDLVPFYSAIENNVSAIMITHTIASGVVDSEGLPSVTSEPVIRDLKQGFPGLIITDDIQMAGLSDFYESKERMYIDLYNADNDMIIFFDRDPKNIDYMISVVENAILSGEISEDKIDRSVTKILEAKGLKVVRKRGFFLF
jgi:beta-glucosidase-like glycosyl hydrolase